MCVESDESWEVFASWWGTGKCGDCGWFGRVLYEEMGPDVEDREEFSEEAVELVLNDGVPDFRHSEDALIEPAWCSGTCEWAGFFARPSYIETTAQIEDTQRICENCAEARRWLSEWCHSFIYGEYLDDISGHWDDAEVGRTITFGRLAWFVKHRWVDRHGRRITQPEASALVQRSLDRLNRQLRQAA